MYQRVGLADREIISQCGSDRVIDRQSAGERGSETPPYTVPEQVYHCALSNIWAAVCCTAGVPHMQ